MSRDVLFVFAHQDDEIAMAARILDERRRGANVYCAFLTDGSIEGSPAVRDAESRAVLSELGVEEQHLFFIGSQHAIRDGTLFRNLDRALALLDEATSSRQFAAMYCLAWEGGHHDHDASHLVTLALARQRDLTCSAREAPLYNAYRNIAGLFRVMSPLPDRPWEKRKISAAEGRRILRLTSRYVSQRRTWRALLPGATIELLLKGNEWMRIVDPARVTARPHRGTLFYEQRFHVAYEDFVQTTAPFIRRYIL